MEFSDCEGGEFKENSDGGGLCFDLGSGSNLRIVHVVLVVVVNDISIIFHPSHLVGY